MISSTKIFLSNRNSREKEQTKNEHIEEGETMCNIVAAQTPNQRNRHETTDLDKKI